ncbi:MAG TPA: CHAT domain-containing protein [Solirubrobacteraceae bacterium]|jgi:CHAT domain-containing protein/tetratricopeptide (TPR) repeat protein
MAEISETLVDSMEPLARADTDYLAGQVAEALVGFDRVLEVFAREGLYAGEMPARVLQGRAAAQLALGYPDDALASCMRALVALGPPGGELDSPACRGAVLNTTGQVLRTKGEFADAVQAFVWAIVLLRDDPGDVLVSALSNLGALASHQGDRPRALSAYREALDMLEQHCPASAQRGHVLVNLAGALRDEGQRDEALERLTEGLGVLRAAGHARAVANALISLSQIHAELERHAQALAEAAEAEELAAKLAPASELHARCVRNRAMIEGEAGDLPAAASGLREALEILAGVAPVSRDVVDTQTRLAATLAGLQDLDGALEQARAAVSCAEQLRERSAVGAGRELLGAVTARAYDALAFCLVRRNEPADARDLIAVLEQRQSRRLLDALGMRAITPPAADERIQRLATLRREARRAQEHVRRGRQALAAGEEAPFSLDELLTIEGSIAHRVIVAEAERGAGVDLAPQTPLDCSALQTSLGERQAVLHCVVTPMVSAVATVTKTTVVVSEVVDVPAQLAGPVDDVASAARREQPIPRRTLDTLADVLLANLPADVEEVIVVADGPLHRLAWALLPVPASGQPLGVAAVLSHATSMTTWLEIAGRATENAGSRDLLLVGAPAYSAEQIPDERFRRLDGTKQEIDAIAALVEDRTILEGEEATEARVLEELPQHRRAHIACHGYVDEDPRSGGLILAPPRPSDIDAAARSDDLLQVWELEDQDLPLELVVLSACSTATGEVLGGEGLLGLIHALHCAGVRQVVAALWPVDDTATARVMTTLYTYLDAGMAVAEALRRTRADHQGGSPKGWAAWVVSGPPASV